MSDIPNIAQLAATIDQTLLSPTVGFSDGALWCSRNAPLGFATLCVAPAFVALAAERTRGTKTRVCSVVGFPLGYATSDAKAEETTRLVDAGCLEIDMVLHIGALLEGNEAYVVNDIAAVVRATAEASDGAGIVKVILETGHLSEDAIVSGSRLSEAAGAAFVKTSTGFGPRGAAIHDVELMRSAVGDRVGIKAAGGIRDLETALAMLEAGATRLGTSSGAEILEQLSARGG